MRKCVKKSDEIRNVNIAEALQLVKAGWNYCSRGEWKSKVRDKDKKDSKKDTTSNKNVKSKVQEESEKRTKKRLDSEKKAYRESKANFEKKDESQTKGEVKAKVE